VVSSNWTAKNKSVVSYISDFTITGADRKCVSLEAGRNGGTSEQRQVEELVLRINAFLDKHDKVRRTPDAANADGASTTSPTAVVLAGIDATATEAAETEAANTSTPLVTSSQA